MLVYSYRVGNNKGGMAILILILFVLVMGCLVIFIGVKCSSSRNEEHDIFKKEHTFIYGERVKIAPGHFYTGFGAVVEHNPTYGFYVVKLDHPKNTTEEFWPKELEKIKE